MLAAVDSCVLVGLEARRVEVQADASTGKVVFNIVGLAATSVKEARERVRALPSALRRSRGRPRDGYAGRAATLGYAIRNSLIQG